MPLGPQGDYLVIKPHAYFPAHADEHRFSRPGCRFGHFRLPGFEMLYKSAAIFFKRCSAPTTFSRFAQRLCDHAFSVSSSSSVSSSTYSSSVGGLPGSILASYACSHTGSGQSPHFLYLLPVLDINVGSEDALRVLFQHRDIFKINDPYKVASVSPFSWNCTLTPSRSCR